MSYINLFYIFIVFAIVMLVLCIVLFFTMDILNAIRIVNKKPPKKKGKKAQVIAATGYLSQNLSEKNDSVPVSQKTEKKKKTTVLAQNQVEMGIQPQPIQQPKKKTTVLQDTNNLQINKKTGDMNAINTNNDIFEIIETTAFIASEKTI